MVNSATDAAIAMNSIKFLELLSVEKAAADLKTYTQSPMQPPTTTVGHTSTTSIIEQHTQSTQNESGSSWGFSSWIFASGNTEQPKSNMHSNNHDCLPNESIHSSSKQHTITTCTSHETVSEYNARLWFLPASKGVIRFRETIRVLEISHDGQSSTVECLSQYHNGSEWVDCSKLVCKFSSVGSKFENGEQQEISSKDEESKVRMALDSELLVWLPLPKAASRAVGKKISSVFESVALGFFEELASI